MSTRTLNLTGEDSDLITSEGEYTFSRACEALKKVLDILHHEQCRLFVGKRDFRICAPEGMTRPRKTQIKIKADMHWEDFSALLLDSNLKDITNRCLTQGYEIEVFGYEGGDRLQLKAHRKYTEAPDLSFPDNVFKLTLKRRQRREQTA